MSTTNDSNAQQAATPRTDAVRIGPEHKHKYWEDFARTLERELAEARKQSVLPWKYCPECTDANAVLPWLEKHDVVCHRVPSNGLWHLRTYSTPEMLFVEAPTFARAAVLILIRATRASK